MRILVVGGAGYIGSVTAELLLARGHQVTVLDNLSAGHRAAVPPGATFVCGDLEASQQVREVLAVGAFDAVMHFAAKSIVPESMAQPGRYFANNVAAVVGLLNAMRETGTTRFVFSSSAAVYGEPEQVPVPEDAPLRPNNPYGASKAVVEQMLPWYSSQGGLRYAALRYFNAAGASVDRGEDHRPETHLIPLAIEAALGLREALTIFGTDYPTPDGTALRDYIHVLDLAEAHLLALEHLERGSLVCNLGSERGYSVLEVVAMVRRVSGVDFPMRYGDRRPGDAPVTVASSQHARAVLGWRPLRDLGAMVESAWRWRRAHPQGYPAPQET